MDIINNMSGVIDPSAKYQLKYLDSRGTQQIKIVLGSELFAMITSLKSNAKCTSFHAAPLESSDSSSD